MQKYLTLLTLFVLLSCSSESDSDTVPAGILSREQMSSVLSDMQIAEALVKATPHLGDTDALAIAGYYKLIYRKHAITDSAFMVSYDYYAHHPVLMDSVYADMIARMSDREAAFKAK